MTNSVSTKVVAWYGAIVATITLLILGFNTWRDRARIKVSAKCGWRIFGPSPIPYDQSKDYIGITVINKGRRSVTITKAGLKLKKGKHEWLIAADSMMYKQRELTEGKSCDFLIEQEQVDLNNIDYAWACDATGKTYKGKVSKNK